MENIFFFGYFYCSEHFFWFFSKGRYQKYVDNIDYLPIKFVFFKKYIVSENTFLFNSILLDHIFNLHEWTQSEKETEREIKRGKGERGEEKYWRKKDLEIEKKREKLADVIPIVYQLGIWFKQWTDR